MAADPLFIAIDVGTTGARACAINGAGRLIRECRRAYATSIPRPGWAEQDPREWRESALLATQELIGSLGDTARLIRAVGLTGQCPTIAPVDAAREPVGPGMLYRDNRAIAQAAQMRERFGDREMHERTGHIASAFHVGPKILWLRENEPEVYAAVDCFMQPRDVVLHALTEQTITDETHANATLFFDLRARVWADDMLEAFSVDAGRFPRVVAPWNLAGEVSASAAERTGLPVGVPVVAGAADSQCAAFGSDVRVPGPISEMAGASSCLNSVVLAPSSDLRITHYSHVVPDCYSTELGVNVTGGALTWALVNFGLDGFDELEARASRVHVKLGEGRVASRLVAPLFLPYLGDGERDDPALRAAFVGMSDRHGRDELVYAVVEGLAFAVAETVSALTAAGSPLEELRVAGGGARLGTLGQIKADALDCPVRHLAHDSASVGVGLLAATAIGDAALVESALAANLARARCFDPLASTRAAIQDRYRWFLDVRSSAAVRLPA